MRYIDLRSDTITQPTPEMRLAMMEAEVGDDVYGDDPTVNRLEALAAKLMGKEAAMLVTSGTMGNQVCIMTHTRYGDEIITAPHAHIVHYECGGPARLSGVNFAMVDNPNCFIYAQDIRRMVRPRDDYHFPHTSLVCLENPLCNGDVVPLQVLQDSYAAAKELGLAVHMDGARVFNAALALGVAPSELAACTDSIMFCLSKGLCAPVGSMVCGTRAFITEARRMRKVLGGGMRQAGVLAACGLVALEKMTLRLGEDHDNAKYLAAQLGKIPGITADQERVKINMVFWQTTNPKLASVDFVDYMRGKGVKVNDGDHGEYRFVTSNDVSRQDIDRVLEYIRAYAE